MYNVDPSVRFWATPPLNGCLTPFVVHPAAFCFHLPDNVSYAEGAMVEPFAIGMQAAAKARLKPGDVALVTGAGTIGMMIALAALAGGCNHVFISDLVQEKLNIIGKRGSCLSTVTTTGCGFTSDRENATAYTEWVG
jgi:D-xylulose reductase